MASILRCSVLGRTLSRNMRTLGGPGSIGPEHRRTFINFPSPPPQTLSSHMTVPYSHVRLYELIADVDSYRTFLPYCSVSRVTAWTPDIVCPSGSGTTRRWPLRADLTAGWGAFEETYTSRLTCIPYHIVEAVSGPDARSEVPASELRRLGLPVLPQAPPGGGGDGDSSGVFKSLVTRWTVTPTASPRQVKAPGGGNGGAGASWSTVQLDIKFQFANPLYAAVSSTVGDKVAPLMVEAFSKRAHQVLGGENRLHQHR